MLEAPRVRNAAELGVVRPSEAPVKVPALPEDLVAFLHAGRRLEYDLAKRGGDHHSPADGTLELELLPMACWSAAVKDEDLHYREMGCYPVPTANLVISRHKMAVLRLVS